MAEQRITIYGEDRKPDRRDLRFPFQAEVVKDACVAKADYHRGRERWWRDEYAKAEGELRESMKLREHEVTGGKRVAAVFDEEKQQRVSECRSKIEEHKRAADEYDAWTVGLSTLRGTVLDISPDDIRFFGLAGGEDSED